MNNNALTIREKIAIYVLLRIVELVQPHTHSFQTEAMVKELKELLK